LESFLPKYWKWKKVFHQKKGPYFYGPNLLI